MGQPLIGQCCIYLKGQTSFRVVHGAELTTPGEALCAGGYRLLLMALV